MTTAPRAGDLGQPAFGRAHPEYAETDALDELRRRDFARLDRDGHAYLDYTAGLYAESHPLRRVSNFADLHPFKDVAAEFTDLRSVPNDPPPRNTC